MLCHVHRASIYNITQANVSSPKVNSLCEWVCVRPREKVHCVRLDYQLLSNTNTPHTSTALFQSSGDDSRCLSDETLRRIALWHLWEELARDYAISTT